MELFSQHMILLAEATTPVWQVLLGSALISALAGSFAGLYTQRRQHSHEREQALRQLMIEAAVSFLTTAGEAWSKIPDLSLSKIPDLSPEGASAQEHVDAKRAALVAGEPAPLYVDLELPTPLREALAQAASEIGATASMTTLRTKLASQGRHIEILFGQSPAVTESKKILTALETILPIQATTARGLATATTYYEYHEVRKPWQEARHGLGQGIEAFPGHATRAIEDPLAVWRAES